LSNITNTIFADHTSQNLLTLNTKATLEEVQQAIRWLCSGKAPGADRIAMDFLKAIRELLVLAITDLLIAS
jgi:hypothetical protein